MDSMIVWLTQTVSPPSAPLWVVIAAFAAAFVVMLLERQTHRAG
jgi:hypothetical protein